MNANHQSQLPQQSDLLPLGAFATVLFTVVLLFGLINLGAIY